MYAGEWLASEQPLGSGNYCPKEAKLMALRVVNKDTYGGAGIELVFTPPYREAAPTKP